MFSRPYVVMRSGVAPSFARECEIHCTHEYALVLKGSCVVFLSQAPKLRFLWSYSSMSTGSNAFPAVGPGSRAIVASSEFQAHHLFNTASKSCNSPARHHIAANHHTNITISDRSTTLTNSIVVPLASVSCDIFSN